MLLEFFYCFWNFFIDYAFKNYSNISFNRLHSRKWYFALCSWGQSENTLNPARYVSFALESSFTVVLRDFSDCCYISAAVFCTYFSNKAL